MTDAPASSALYVGAVTHRRLRPRVHSLSYRLASLLLDLDEIDALGRRLRWLSIDRFNLFSFYRRDRGDGGPRELKAQVEAHLARVGLAPDGGPIRLLTMPRVLGWQFNPLSVYFCHRRSGALFAILWEVDNTFGQRHAYLIPAVEGPDGRVVQSCDKAFYVSPFMDMDLRYDFQLALPGDTLDLVIDVSDREGLLMRARQIARRVELTDAALLKIFFGLPLLTLRVVGGILWEALKLWLKGVRLRRRPPPPDEAVSYIPLPPAKSEVASS